MNQKKTLSPHIKSDDSINSIMLDVLIAMIPVLFVGAFIFGKRTLAITAISVVSCVLLEWICCKLLKRPNSIGDLSAAVTGMLIAFMMPVAAPVWMPVVGAVVAIVVVKQLSGGIGKNIFNPAAAAWVVLRVLFPTQMSYYTPPYRTLSLFGNVDISSVSTPLGIIQEGGALSGVNVLDMFLGQTAGSFGATSALALLVGGIYLLYRRVISYRIPLAYLGVVAAAAFLFPMAGLDHFTSVFCQLFGGNLMLAAVFMANDTTTSPVTKLGQWVYGIGCGVLTMVIRYVGVYPDGVCYAILLMNVLVVVLDTKRPWVLKKKG